ncbi:MAG: hydrogenase, partial [Dokdonella sp.]|nr:hydrogenase [Dokdonella sp.]
ISTGFDLWRAIAAAYASAYMRTTADAMPCGYAFAALNDKGQPTRASLEMRASWWADSSGIPPGTGVSLIDSMADGESGDPALPALQCLRALWTGDDAKAQSLHAGVEATRAAVPRDGLPLIVIHGADDGLIPDAFSSAAYVQRARAHGRDPRYWRIANAQHFDAFLGLPMLASRYVPLMPYAYRALDAMWAHLQDDTPLPASAEVDATPRKADASGIAPLRPDNVPMP